MSKVKLIEIFDKQSPNTPLSDGDAHVMMSILMGDNDDFKKEINDIDINSDLFKHFKPLLEAFQTQVFIKRIEHLTTLKLTLGGLVLTMMQVETAGDAVMLAFYLHYKLPENTIVTPDIFCEKLFPWGFFTEKQLSEIWKEQKDGGTNMIDNSNNWKD